MAKTVVFESHHVMTNAENNNNKFWRIFRYDDHSTLVEFGRVGDSGQKDEKSFGSESQAIAFCTKKCSEKEKKGYRKVEIMTSNVAVKVSPSGSLTEVAKKQIQTKSTEVQKLIEYFSQVNIHNILESTNMNYNVDSGLFSTPIGIVTKETVDKARDILIKMDKFALKNDFSKPAYVHLLEDYMMLIPQKIGRKFDPTSIFTSRTDLLKQNDVLDSLEASITSILNATIPAPTDAPEEKTIFNVSVELLEDKKEFQRIYDFFLSTKHNNHVSAKYKLKKVYCIEINHMKKAYDPVSKKLGNVMELWHGTKASNILSILKSGLVMPNPRASNFTGAMFSVGIYGSDQSTKSLNYATNYWNGHGDSSKTFMFLADFAMGKSFIPSGPRSDLPLKGYDSTFAIGGKSGVQNNEMIVYNTNQVNLKYLCEFE